MVAEYTSSYVFAGSTSATETGLLRVKERPCHGLRRTVAKDKNFESSAEPPSVIKKQSVRFVRLLCASLRVGRCMKLYVWRLSQALDFFSRAPSRPWPVDPIFDALEHCLHRKLELSYPWRSDQRPWTQRRYRLSSKKRLSHGGLRDYFYSKKKKFKVTTEKKKGKKKVRENE